MNKSQLEGIMREIEMLQHKSISRQYFNQLQQAVNHSSAIQMQFRDDLLGKLKGMESTMINKETLQNYLNRAEGIQRDFNEHFVELKAVLGQHRAEQIADCKTIVQHVTSLYTEIKQQITVECDKMKTHMTSEANRVIAAMQALFSQFLNPQKQIEGSPSQPETIHRGKEINERYDNSHNLHFKLKGDKVVYELKKYGKTLSPEEAEHHVKMFFERKDQSYEEGLAAMKGRLQMPVSSVLGRIGLHAAPPKAQPKTAEKENVFMMN